MHSSNSSNVDIFHAAAKPNNNTNEQEWTWRDFETHQEE